jgi:multicomponent K+:H+ antiporter subunit D
MNPVHLVIAPILIPLAAGAFMLFFEDREHHLKAVLSLASVLGLVIVAALLVLRVNSGEGPAALVYLIGNWPVPVAINLVAERLSTLMLLVTSLLALPALFFATDRWERAGPHFYSLFQFLLVGINGAFLTGDLFNLFVFFEVMLAASYGLLLHGGGQARVRSGLHYVAVNLVASFVFLVGIAMVYAASGSLNMAEISLRAEGMQGFDRPVLNVGVAMLGLAFLVKAGMWPLGNWLVPAYSAAAGPVSAIFAVLSKVGIYALLRLALLVPSDGVAFGARIMFIGGSVTLAIATIGVLAAQSLKRAGAYFVLMSSGTLLATFGLSRPATTAGALFYLVSSTLALGAFFFVVELLERERDAASDVIAVTAEAYGEGESAPEEEVGSLMPGAVAILGLGFGLLAMVLIGLPPLPGFLAKFAIISSAFLPAMAAPDPTFLRPSILAGLLVLSGVAGLLTLSRIGIRIFWTPIEPFTPRITIRETAPVLFILALLAVLVVRAGPAMDLFTATADDLHHQTRYLDAVFGAGRVPIVREGQH